MAWGTVLLVCLGFAATAAPLQVLFMHHSTGGNLIREGGVREALTALGYAFSDHGYNDEGLTGPDGEPTGDSFGIPDDNTNPDGWAAVFRQSATAADESAFRRMLDYDVIVFKSCFPVSNIADEETLAGYARDYLVIRDVMDAHPEKLFIAFTPPPLVPNETEPENAARARRWALYLSAESYVGGRANLAVFDFFSLLAGPDGMLRPEYRGDEWDSHPNATANETIGPLLVAFIDAAVARWEAAR